MRPTTTSPNIRRPAARAATAVAAYALVASLAFGTAAAAGEEQVVMFRDRVPEASELAGILFPAAGPDAMLRGRDPAPRDAPRVGAVRAGPGETPCRWPS